MILFLNVDKQKITLYGKEGMIDIPFKNAGQLYKYVKDNNILYITNAIETNAKEVINSIKDMGVVIEEVAPPVQEKKTCIHVAGEEIIPIDDLLRFRGYYDVHPLTSELVQKIKETPLLQSLIKNKKLELITSSERKRIKEEYDRKEDEKIGSILVDRDDMDKQKEHGDAEVIELISEVAGARPSGGSEGIGTMSELMDELEGLE